MRRSLVLACLLGSFATATEARAQQTDHDQAKRHFDLARRHVAEKRCDLAIPEFQASIDFEPSVGARLNLGDCFAAEAHLDEAWRQYKEAEELAMARRDGRVGLARHSAAAIAAKVVHVIVREPNPPVDGLVLRVDGNPVPLAWFSGILVDPEKPHVLEATAPGREPWQTSVTGAAGEIVRLEIELKEVPVGDDAPPTPPPAPPAKPSTLGAIADAPPAIDATRAGQTQRTIGLVTGAVGLAALATGAVAGLLTLRYRSDLASAVSADARCTGGYPSGSCAPAAQADLQPLQDRATTSATIATVASLAGVALAAAGVVLYFTAPRARASALRVGAKAASAEVLF